MTELLFQTDSYLNIFETTISAIDQENHALLLERTAFYPGGGGQPSDTGVLDFEGLTYKINKVKKAGLEIPHFVDKEQELPSPGSLVTGQIDWQRRYALMRTHTALHILCGVVFRDYGALVTGGNMEPLKGRMDFEFETMHKELVQEIEFSVNQEVSNARDVFIEILPRRSVPDPGFDPHQDQSPSTRHS